MYTRHAISWDIGPPMTYGHSLGAKIHVMLKWENPTQGIHYIANLMAKLPFLLFLTVLYQKKWLKNRKRRKRRKLLAR